MNKHIFVFLFIIGAFCLCSCADDFATRINLDGNSSGEDFNSEAALYGTVQDNYGNRWQAYLSATAFRPLKLTRKVIGSYSAT